MLLLAGIVHLTFFHDPLRGQNSSAPIVVGRDVPTATPAFDVVSIKPNNTGSGNVSTRTSDGHFDASNVSLRMLILNVYDLKENQLTGLPHWAESDRFDIKAKISEPDSAVMKHLTREQRQGMLEVILLDHFQLKFHHELKTLPVYEMVLVKDGPKFKETAAAEMASETGVNGVRAGSISIHNTQLYATGVPLSDLAAQLSGQLHRIVIDKTGLNGKYNLSLAWTPDDTPPGQESTAPTLFTALQEQLGLRLQSTKADVKMFVVDSASLPGDN
ncbi:TIGR03435 family protein [Granulicella arctica]|uniref:TIGR03435 family protein n=1 Tax=Granulicella arctica TaxID=940613 RepID=UPI0021DFDF9D|nr:TIGR03435 family protein [Granulicella arctica]